MARYYGKPSDHPPDTVFVFGSNLRGLHGAGAAIHAKAHWGAIQGVGKGLQGQSYALPTKGLHVQKLSLQEIANNVAEFLQFAENHPEKTFLVTAVGTGLAGYPAASIGPLFKGAPPNVVLPVAFTVWIEKEGDAHESASPSGTGPIQP